MADLLRSRAKRLYLQRLAERGKLHAEATALRAAVRELDSELLLLEEVLGDEVPVEEANRIRSMHYIFPKTALSTAQAGSVTVTAGPPLASVSRPSAFMAMREDTRVRVLSLWEILRDHGPLKTADLHARLIEKLGDRKLAGTESAMYEILRRLTDEVFRKDGVGLWSAIPEPDVPFNRVAPSDADPSEPEGEEDA
jgi:hypothetical protein